MTDFDHVGPPLGQGPELPVEGGKCPAMAAPIGIKLHHMGIAAARLKHRVREGGLVQMPICGQIDICFIFSKFN
jgi:hypothetical protein